MELLLVLLHYLQRSKPVRTTLPTLHILINLGGKVGMAECNEACCLHSGLLVNTK